MLVEAVNAPADGVIPGGLDNVRDDDENLNFGQWEGPLPPQGAAALENEAEREDDHDQPEDENEEEEDISVSQTTFVKFHDLSEMTFVALKPMPRAIRNIIGRFMFWGRNTQNEESSSEEEDVPLDDTGVD